jgi:hypothetical protein
MERYHATSVQSSRHQNQPRHRDRTPPISEPGRGGMCVGESVELVDDIERDVT